MRNKKAIVQVMAIVILTVITSLISGTASAQLIQAAEQQPTIIEQWQTRLFYSNKSFIKTVNIEQLLAGLENGYLQSDTEEKRPKRLKQSSVAWIKFQLPQHLDYERPALYIDKLYGQNMLLVLDHQIMIQSERNYPYINNPVLLPLTSEDSNKNVFILLETEASRIGLHSSPRIDNIDNLEHMYTRHGIMDIVSGATCVIIGLLILLGSFIIVRSKLRCFYWLGSILLLSGTLIITSSNYVYFVYPGAGIAAYYLAEVSALLLPLFLFYLLESLFGKGQHQLIARTKKVQLAIALIGCIWLFSSFFNAEILGMYRQISIILLGLSALASILFLIVFLIHALNEKNKEALIFIAGFALFGICIAVDQLRFLGREGDYSLYLWKWGLLALLATFILLHIRFFLRKYEQLLLYSEQLESLNNELQRSEKLEMINQIAASVAHEIRNPIQVTRGFLQLLSSNSLTTKEVGYVKLAISELDRATEIITDFLNFAKPQYEKNTILKLNDELDQIKAIIFPLAVVHGHQIEMRLEPELYVRGSSSDFKQALINIIKNSIEAIKAEGLITIQAYKRIEKNKIMIIIEDNGEGMKEADLKRLGEPFYSQKTKGTGIGLSVTFRIIQAMQGEMLFYSQIGQGTKVKIILPIAYEDAASIN
ncbi:ATP-binding protein [Paenibacillus sp. GXUN7292]|uniref:ATP-binding protein n=1 Tax=Paenibacillus sp. GXUN7292 TaxID=3422499 RepID=UPI003D7E69D6